MPEHGFLSCVNENHVTGAPVHLRVSISQDNIAACEHELGTDEDAWQQHRDICPHCVHLK